MGLHGTHAMERCYGWLLRHTAPTQQPSWPNLVVGAAFDTFVNLALKSETSAILSYPGHAAMLGSEGTACTRFFGAPLCGLGVVSTTAPVCPARGGARCVPPSCEHVMTCIALTPPCALAPTPHVMRPHLPHACKASFFPCNCHIVNPSRKEAFPQGS